MTNGAGPGMDKASVLSHVSDPTPPTGFQQFWSTWHDRAWSTPSVLEAVSDPAAARLSGAPGVTHTIAGVGGVRLGCRLDVPAGIGGPRGVVVLLHGYGMSPAEPLTAPTRLVERGLAALTLRVRGYPGSQFDTGDLVSGGGYAARRMDDPTEWSIGLAVADVVSAFRAVRHEFGHAIPISVCGESFGGGLAVIAASVIAVRDGVYRLAIGLPSLGDWAWRLSSAGSGPCAGSIGHDVASWLNAHPDAREAVMRSLRLFDAVTHARRVTCPVVCKLALHDPVVAPETAAAIINALAVSPGLKWRFVTTTGHTSGTSAEVVADLRRHALYERLAAEFLDPAEYPQELMKRWEPLLGKGVQPPAATG